ncbi:ferritin-like domain-containing protein [Pseudorhodobacter turbinis]|uniref:Ferritin-like domain-containing protein n=1 Tax=Pseudorhodobacter turbinis TaxID=2500533 RepID=A0A4P8EDB9_9RHOB|nr:ferritin-like domain-containing protein [Pseudorhodobacter turbinis]QCO54728.1 ferritin-like domain-containing protein [Pseudorhodobacter turbinis]
MATSTASNSNATANKKKTKTSTSGKTRTVSKAKPDAKARTKRASAVAQKSAAKTKATAKARTSSDKGLSDLLEHGLKDIYYAEKKIYRALPKMIKAAEDDALVEALTSHREETAEQIETLENAFEAMGLRAKGEKCDAIDGILTEAESILDDFGGSFASDAAIIFSCQAVEHYEIARYTSLVGFADALGLDDVQELLQSILDQENAAHTKLEDLAEGSINEAASEYDEDDTDSHSDDSKSSAKAKK